MEVVTRKEAIVLGVTRYYTGIQCSNGHFSERRVNGSQCLTCDRIKHKKASQEVRNRKRLYQNRYDGSHRLEAKARSSKHRKEHPSACRADRADRAKRRAVKLNALPKWADVLELRKIFLCRPSGMHVDHIIPLQNPSVSGLHVPWNLQYLTPKENLSKGNKLLPEYANGSVK